MTTQVEKKLRTFENIILRICGPVYDDVANCWQRKNVELSKMTKIPVNTSYSNKA